MVEFGVDTSCSVDLAKQSFRRIRTDLKAFRWYFFAIDQWREAANDPSSPIEARNLGVGRACLSRLPHIGLDWAGRILGVESNFDHR